MHQTAYQPNIACALYPNKAALNLDLPLAVPDWDLQYLDLQNVLKDERQKTSTLEQSNAGLMQSVNNLEVENKRLNARNNMQQEEYAKIYRRMCLYAQELDELKPL